MKKKMRTEITATVNRIEKSSISLGNVHSNGKWVSYLLVMRNPKKWQNEIRERDTISFSAELKTFNRRQFNGDTWDSITCHRLSNPSKVTIINPS